MKSIFLCKDEKSIRWVYAPETIEALKAEAGLCETVYDKEDILARPEAFHDVEYIFSTWGMAVMTEEEIRTAFPNLKCVFYGAGSVQPFARPFLNCGVKVFSAWVANAVPVAEYTVAQIILANKGFYATSRMLSAGDTVSCYKTRAEYRGNYGATVGLVGVGQISRLVIKMLKNYRLNVKVCSRSLSDAEAAEMGVTKCSLEELFATCQVVSNHQANNAATQGMMQKRHFAAMLPYATFLNTGRGAQVVEADLAEVLKERPDLTAVLDVTFPEPPEAGHEFYSLPNCVLSPHIAGSQGDEVCRMSEYMLEEFRLFTTGQPCRYEVSMKMLETMA